MMKGVLGPGNATHSPLKIQGGVISTSRRPVCEVCVRVCVWLCVWLCACGCVCMCGCVCEAALLSLTCTLATLVTALATPRTQSLRGIRHETAQKGASPPAQARAEAPEAGQARPRAYGSEALGARS